MNFFACLDDSGDEEVQIKNVPKKEDKKKVGSASKENVANNKQSPTVDTPAQNGATAAPEKKGKDTKNKSVDTSAPRPAPNSKADIAARTEPDNVVKKDDLHSRNNKTGDRRPDAKGRGGGRGDRERAPRPPRTEGDKPAEDEAKPRREKREFDRKPSSNRSGGPRKQGSGAYGIGNVEQEAHDAEKDPSKAEIVIESIEEEGVEAITTEPVVETPAVPEVVVPPEPPTFTLGDYLARKTQERAAYNPEVFGEIKVRTVEDSVIEGKKYGTELTDFIAGKEGKKKVVATKAQRSTAKSAITDVLFKAVGEDEIDASTRPPRREEGGDRRGRGEGRGGRGAGRGGGRGPARYGGGRFGDNGGGASVDVNDSYAFPSL